MSAQRQLPSAQFTLVGFGMQPESVTELLGVQPTEASISYVRRCATGRKEECGLWSFNTSGSVPSRDIAEHLEYLGGLFKPKRSTLEEIRPKPNIFIHLRCEPAIFTHPFLAPRIEAKHIATIAELGAALTVELVEKSTS